MAKKLIILDGEYFFYDDKTKGLKKIEIKEDVSVEDLTEKQAKEMLLLVLEDE